MRLRWITVLIVLVSGGHFQLATSSISSSLSPNGHSSMITLRSNSLVGVAHQDQVSKIDFQQCWRNVGLPILSRDSSNAPSAAAEGGHGGRRTIPTSAARRRSMRIAHGVLMSIAFVLFLPLGGILVRMLGPKDRIILHVTTQLSAYGFAIAGLGLEIWLGRYVRYLDYAHTVIGMVVLATMSIQALFGVVHHMQYKKSPHKLTWWRSASIHAWLGRVLLALAIINGGLGLMLADNTKGGRIAYGVVAGIIGLTYLTVIIQWLIKKRNESALLDSESYEI